MVKAEFKTWPDMFEKVNSGEKTFELRLYDKKVRDLKSGDKILLNEWDPKRGVLTGRSLIRRVGYIMALPSVSPANDLPYWTANEVQKHGLAIISLIWHIGG